MSVLAHSFSNIATFHLLIYRYRVIRNYGLDSHNKSWNPNYLFREGGGGAFVRLLKTRTVVTGVGVENFLLAKIERQKR